MGYQHGIPTCQDDSNPRPFERQTLWPLRKWLHFRQVRVHMGRGWQVCIRLTLGVLHRWYFHYHCSPDHRWLFYCRHVLTGSYHNYFRIYDTDTLNDVVLQADKSAFKAKKIGGPLPGAKAGIKNGPRVGGLRDAMQLETLDFNKKILHASWHPRENTIAVGENSSWATLVFWPLCTDRRNK